jgi:hypothetical protein
MPRVLKCLHPVSENVLGAEAAGDTYAREKNKRVIGENKCRTDLSFETRTCGHVVQKNMLYNTYPGDLLPW